VACLVFLHLFSYNRILITCLFFYYLVNMLFLNCTFLDYIFENWIYSLFCMLINTHFSFFSFFFIFLFTINYFGKVFYFNLLFLSFLNLEDSGFIFNDEIPSFNTGLFNGLLLSHPLFLFLSYSFVFIITSYCFFYNVYLSSFYNNYKFFLLYLLRLLICAIFLGSLWAQQELNWGGWWGWDIIELGSLFWLIFMISILHSKHYNFNFIFLHNFFLLFFTFFYLGVRFSFFDSVHSFVSSSITDFKSLSYFYILPLLILAAYSKVFKYKNIIQLFIKTSLFLIFLIILKDFFSKYYFIISTNVNINFFLVFILLFFFFVTFRSLTFYYYAVLPFILNFISFSKAVNPKARNFHGFAFIFLFTSILLKFHFFQNFFYNPTMYSSIIVTKHFFITITKFGYFTDFLFVLNNFLFKKGLFFITSSFYFNFETLMSQSDILTNCIVYLNFFFLSFTCLSDFCNLLPSIICLILLLFVVLCSFFAF
jgi:hypothetical protein